VTPLCVHNLSRSFGGVQAIDSVSLALEAGERRAVIGTNGAGKTTLFNVINGQIPASSGEIWLFGVEVSTKSMHERVRLGLGRTFQITSLFPDLTVFENMIIAVQALHPSHFVLWRRLARQRDVLMRAEALLERWHLRELRHTQVRHLSYGTQRQLEIVVALAGEPRLLLLDEPMAGLSAAETHLATDIIVALDRTVTILLIEHDLSAAFRIADRVTAMDRGRIVAEGTPEEIRKEGRLQAIYTRGGASG
jgi:branched-chain amino acid transport system ATP-binding protein